MLFFFNMCSVWLYPFALIHIEELGKNSSDIFRSDAEVGIFSGHLQSSSVFYSLSFFALFSLLFFFFSWLLVAVLARCTTSVSFLRHIVKRFDLRKPLKGGSPELCHTAQRQIVMKSWRCNPEVPGVSAAFSPDTFCHAFIMRYLWWKVFSSLFPFLMPWLLQKNDASSLFILKVYGRPIHAAACNLFFSL